MALFLKNSVFFIVRSLLYSVVLVIVWLAASALMLDFTLKKGVTTVFIGSSRIQTTVNDALISDAKNIARGGEAYLYNYLKLKKVVEANPDIKRVVIGFDNTNIGAKSNEWTYGEKYLKHSASFYLTLFGTSELNIILINNRDVFVDNLGRMVFKNILGLVATGGRSILSESQYFKVNKKMGIDKVIFDGNQPDLKAGREFAQINLSYLRKMVDLCESNEIQVLFLRPPLHQSSKRWQAEVQFQDILTEDFSNIQMIDLGRMALPDSLYADESHLNSSGANILTDSLRIILESIPFSRQK